MGLFKRKKKSDNANSMVANKESEWESDLVKILGSSYTMGELMQWLMNDAERENDTHQIILKNLALKDEDPGVREYAANKITNVDILCNIILNELDKMTRMAAVDSLNYMEDYKTLKKISSKITCKNEQDQDVKEYILKRLD